MFVQRFGGSLNLNVHFHVVLMDGVFTRDDGARVHFHEAEAPSEEELLGLATQTYTNAVRWLRRHGHLADSSREARGNGDVQIEALQGCAEIAMQRGSFTRAAAEGHDNAASRKRSFPRAKSRFVAECEGFNVHAAVRIPRGDDLGRERLCRYGARPAMALGRLRVLRSGVVAYRVKDVSAVGATRAARVKHRGRVAPGVSAGGPHRSGHAEFPHPALRELGLLPDVAADDARLREREPLL
jgi:hypothetical protein